MKKLAEILFILQLALPFPALASTFLAESAEDILGEFTCVSTAFRGGLGKERVDARFNFVIKLSGDVMVLSKLIGHVIVAREWDIRPEEAYYSIFALEDLKQNVRYVPRVYFNFIQFRNVNTRHSSRADGGGMWGDLVMSRDRAGDFEAHYIFKAGDHLGGTIDFTCSK